MDNIEELLIQAPDQDDDNYPIWLAQQFFKTSTPAAKASTTTPTATITEADTSALGVHTELIQFLVKLSLIYVIEFSTIMMLFTFSFFFFNNHTVIYSSYIDYIDYSCNWCCANKKK